MIIPEQLTLQSQFNSDHVFAGRSSRIQIEFTRWGRWSGWDWKIASIRSSASRRWIRICLNRHVRTSFRLFWSHLWRRWRSPSTWRVLIRVERYELWNTCHALSFVHWLDLRWQFWLYIIKQTASLSLYDDFVFFVLEQLFLDDNVRNVAAGNAVGLRTVLVCVHMHTTFHNDNDISRLIKL